MFSIIRSVLWNAGLAAEYFCEAAFALRFAAEFFGDCDEFVADSFGEFSAEDFAGFGSCLGVGKGEFGDFSSMVMGC